MALYWAIISLTTMGYGDIVPTNQDERVFCIVGCVCVCVCVCARALTGVAVSCGVGTFLYAAAFK